MTQVLERSGRVSPLRPNWENPVTMSYDFKTSIHTSYDGTEQREAMRETPRVAVEFNSLMRPEGVSRLLSDAAEGFQTPFTLPVPPRRLTLTSDASAGTDTLQVSSAAFWLTQGMDLVIEDESKQEVVTISSVVSSTITLLANLTGTFLSGSAVFQASSARLPQAPQFSARLPGVWEGAVRFEVDPGTGYQPIKTSSPTTFEGTEVFETRPNWASPAQITFDEERQVLDPGRGIIQTFAPVGYTRLSRQAGLTFVDAGAAEDFLAFFLRMKGRRGEFWCPTFTQDLLCIETKSSGATTFKVSGVDADAAYSGSSMYSVLAALWPDGDLQVNRVSAVTNDGTDSEFTVADPWDQQISPDTTFSWCLRSRLATDRMQLSWITQEVSETQFTTFSLPNEAA